MQSTMQSNLTAQRPFRRLAFWTTYPWPSLRSRMFLLCCLLFAGSAMAERPDLLPIEEPTIGGMDLSVREQLQSAWGELRHMVADPATPPELLAEAYGGIGQIYLAYDLVTPATAALENALRLAPEDWKTRYLLGSLHQNEGRLREAAELFAEVVSGAPFSSGKTAENQGFLATRAPSPVELVATWIRLGNVRLDLDQPAAAMTAFNAALGIDSGSAAAHAGLGKGAALQGDPTAAAEHFRRALELQPEASALHYHLAIALRELGQTAAARQQLTSRGNVEAAFPDPVAQSVLQLATGSGVHLMFGNRALRQGQIDLAIERYRQALAVNPRSSEVHRSLAAAYERRGDRQQAIEHYSSALALAPDNPSSHYNLGTILVEQGDDEQATRHFLAALRLAPDYDNARFNLAAVLARNGLYARALPHYETLLSRESSDHAIRFYAAHTLQNLGQHERANALLRQLLQEDAERHRARLALARGLLAEGEVEAARGELHRLLESRGVALEQRRGGHLELARLEAQQQHWDTALQHFGEVLEVDDGNAEAHFGRAMALLLAERYNEAAEALETANRRLPEDRELRHLLARFLATCPVRDLRHGQRALEISFDLLQQQQQQRLDIAQTAAMALAEQGRFDEAIVWQQRLIQQAQQAAPPQVLHQLLEELERYRLGQAVVAPWLPSLQDPVGSTN